MDDRNEALELQSDLGTLVAIRQGQAEYVPT